MALHTLLCAFNLGLRNPANDGGLCQLVVGNHGCAFSRCELRVAVNLSGVSTVNPNYLIQDVYNVACGSGDCVHICDGGGKNGHDFSFKGGLLCMRQTLL